MTFGVMLSLHVTGTRLGMRLGSLYISVVCTYRLVHFAYIGAYGSLCLVSFDLQLMFGGHDFTDENAHTDSDGSLLPKGTPALVALDIAHI